MPTSDALAKYFVQALTNCLTEAGNKGKIKEYSGKKPQLFYG